MLLARLLGWIKGHTTIHIFMLEILAVFIGISGSLFVDTWREQQADYEKLDRELRNLHWVLQRQISNHMVASRQITGALESAVLLGFGNAGDLSDEELLDHFWRATYVAGFLGEFPNFNSTNDKLSIPYSETVAMIEGHLRDVRSSSGYFDAGIGAVIDQRVAIIERSGLVSSQVGTAGIAEQDLVEMAVEMDTVTGGVRTEYVADKHNLASIRDVTDDPEIKARFRQLIMLHQMVGKANLIVIQMKRNTVDAILRYAPDISIPFAEVGIDGSGTAYGWQTYLPMTQDESDPAVWRIVLDLVDGEVKFRADNAWAVNWGTSEFDAHFDCDETMTDECGAWSFQGDLSKAFPVGKAQLEGSNIPVRAGRYEIMFNTETLDYSFERL